MGGGDTYLELVGVALAGGNGALADGRDTILPLSVLLTESVPMQGGTFRVVVNVVVDRDLDPVSPVCLNGGAGVSSVHQEDLTLISIWGDDTSADGEVIVADDTSAGPLLVVVRAVGCQRAPREAVGQRVVVQKVRKLGGIRRAEDALSV